MWPLQSYLRNALLHGSVVLSVAITVLPA
jgi:hypothetical protein